MAKSIFILGSSRSFGNTRKVIVDVAEKEEIEIIDLSTKRISFFDYEHHNKQDDFIPLIESILPYETIVLATPINITLTVALVLVSAVTGSFNETR